MFLPEKITIHEINRILKYVLLWGEFSMSQNSNVLKYPSNLYPDMAIVESTGRKFQEPNSQN